MTDIVERLRADARGGYAQYWRETAAEAAAEIERLRSNEAAAIFAFRETNDIALEEIKRMRADIDKLMWERDGWLDEIERLRSALQDLLRACEAIGVFKNGVEHNGIDEGETIAAGYMDAARRALDLKP